MGKLNYRVVIFLFALLFGIVFSIPSLVQSESGRKITLGLDLQGGLHMLLGVKTDEAIKSYTKSLLSTAKYELDKADIVIDNVQINKDKASFEVVDEDEVQNALKLLKERLKDVQITANKNVITIALTPELIKKVKQRAITQAVETIRNRLNQFGLAEPTVAKQGQDKILVEIPGVKTQEDIERLKKLISKQAHLVLMAVDEDRADRVNTMSEAEARKYGDVILPDEKNPQIKYLVKAIPILDGSMVTDAKAVYDKNGQPIITFTLNGEGARIFLQTLHKKLHLLERA